MNNCMQTNIHMPKQQCSNLFLQNRGQGGRIFNVNALSVVGQAGRRCNQQIQVMGKLSM